MLAGKFFIRLQHGITGGIRPPTVNAVHTIQLKDSDTLMITSAVRPDGAEDLTEPPHKEISSKEQHTASLLEELCSILQTIPTELPPGSEDIYGMDTSIFLGSDEFEWMNGAPGGCGHGVSSVKPTEEDKAKFRRAVLIVKELTGKGA